MRELILKAKATGSSVVGHVNAHPKSGCSMVFFLPGGPGISGEYWDRFAKSISEKLGKSVCVLDLPNHGESLTEKRNLPVTYETCVQEIQLFINGLAEIASDYWIVGHSFGSRISLDLVRGLKIAPKGLILVDCPPTLNASKEFRDRTAHIESKYKEIRTNSEFRDYWRALVPFYFLSPPTAEQLEVLTGSVFWEGNQIQADGLPTLKTSAENAATKLSNDQILFIMGEKDIRQPDQHRELIRQSFPQSKILLVSDSGHFSMLENPLELLEKFEQILG